MAVKNEQAAKSIDLSIGYFMVEKKINNGQMANLLGMSANTLRWQREGKTDWSWSEILLLSEILGKSPDVLSGLAKA